MNFPAGSYADLVGPWIVLEAPGRESLYLLENTRVIHTLAGGWDPSEGKILALYPKIAQRGETWAVVAQSGSDVVVWTEDWVRALGVAGSPEPAAISRHPDGWLIWSLHPAPRRLMQTILSPSETVVAQESFPTQSTQGIDSIGPDGRPILVDDLLHNLHPLAQTYPLSRPFQSGRLVVGENISGPDRALAFLNGDLSKPYRLHDGVAFRPRAASIPTGGWRVVFITPAGAEILEVPPFIPDGAPVPVPPVPVPPTPMPNPPGVDIFRYDPVLTPDSDWTAEIRDRNNPEVEVGVYFRRGSFHARLKNSAGEDESGLERRVEIRGIGTIPAPAPQPIPIPTPAPGDLAPITIGQWNGNFLFPGDPFFFGPSCAAWDPNRRAAYFAHLRARGDTHVLINAEQDDWGPLRGHPEWTSGGFTAYHGRMPEFVEVLREARRAGLIPCVGVVDQPTLRVHSLDTIIGRTRNLVEATWEHVALYMLSWEIEEVWSNGDIREPNLERWIGEIGWAGRDVGIHFAAGNLSGGFNFYGRMPSNVVRLYQWEASADDAQLAHEARLIADVARGTNTKVCAFEHSSSLNQSPVFTETECRRRAQICLREMAFLRPDQFGSLNG